MEGPREMSDLMGPLHPAMSQVMGLPPTTVTVVQWLGGLCHSGNISQLH